MTLRVAVAFVVFLGLASAGPSAPCSGGCAAASCEVRGTGGSLWVQDAATGLPCAAVARLTVTMAASGASASVDVPAVGLLTIATLAPASVATLHISSANVTQLWLGNIAGASLAVWFTRASVALGSVDAMLGPRPDAVVTVTAQRVSGALHLSAASSLPSADALRPVPELQVTVAALDTLGSSARPAVNISAGVRVTARLNAGGTALTIDGPIAVAQGAQQLENADLRVWNIWLLGGPTAHLIRGHAVNLLLSCGTEDSDSGAVCTGWDVALATPLVVAAVPMPGCQVVVRVAGIFEVANVTLLDMAGNASVSLAGVWSGRLQAAACRNRTLDHVTNTSAGDCIKLPGAAAECGGGEDAASVLYARHTWAGATVFLSRDYLQLHACFAPGPVPPVVAPSCSELPASAACPRPVTLFAVPPRHAPVDDAAWQTELSDALWAQLVVGFPALHASDTLAPSMLSVALWRDDGLLAVTLQATNQTALTLLPALVQEYGLVCLVRGQHVAVFSAPGRHTAPGGDSATGSRRVLLTVVAPVTALTVICLSLLLVFLFRRRKDPAPLYDAAGGRDRDEDEDDPLVKL